MNIFTQIDSTEGAMQRVNTRALSPYPIDIAKIPSPALHMFDAAGISYKKNPEGYCPTSIALDALAHWNQYLASGEENHRDVFFAQANWLIEHEVLVGEECGGWPVSLSHPDVRAGDSWLSALTQGNALSVLARAYQLTQDKRFLESMRRVVRTFERDVLDGGVSVPVGADGVFFEEIAVYPASHSLSGCLFALLGLYDYLVVQEDAQISALIQRCLATLHILFDEFDTGFWTRVDLLHRSFATPAHLALQQELLRALASYSHCEQCVEVASRWEKYSHRWDSRLRHLIMKGFLSCNRVLLKQVRSVLFPNSQRTSPLRVCIPVVDFPFPGGILTVLNDIAQVTADIWRVEYLTQNVGPDPGERVIHLFGKPKISPWYFPLVWLYTLTGFAKLLSLLRRLTSYDIILPQDGVFTSAFAALAAKLAGVRVVCIDHSTLTWPISRAFRKERINELSRKPWPLGVRFLVRLLLILYWPSLSLLARLSVRCVDHFLLPGIPGDDMEQACTRLGVRPSRITRFASMVDTERRIVPNAQLKRQMREQKGIAADAIVIAIICRLAPEKGLDVAVSSIRQALTEISPDVRARVRVIIAGDGPLRAQVEEQIKVHDLSLNCTLWGEISPEDVISLLAISNIFLYTSVRGACFPMAVLEAMASSCAVIASTEPKSNAVLLAEGRGIAVSAGNREQTSAALVQLINDPEMCLHMGALVREYISSQHSPAIFKRTLTRVTYWSELRELLKDNLELETSAVRQGEN